jgi:hypothetical protein
MFSVGQIIHRQTATRRFFNKQRNIHNEAHLAYHEAGLTMNYCLERSAEYHKNPVGADGPGAVIWIRYLPNMNQDSNNFYFFFNYSEVDGLCSILSSTSLWNKIMLTGFTAKILRIKFSACHFSNSFCAGMFCVNPSATAIVISVNQQRIRIIQQCQLLGFT